MTEDQGYGSTEVVEVDDPLADPETRELAADYARRFRANGRKRLRVERRSERRFRRSLRRHWGTALDKYLLTCDALYDVGSMINDEGRGIAAEENDYLFEALTRLHSRACQVARSVHLLLSGGYVEDALARCRTLHELAVISIVLGDYGREPEHAELAERFLLHSIVQSAEDADQYREHRKNLGSDPLDAKWLTQTRMRRDHLVARFGQRYKDRYGWAIGLPKLRKNITFDDLTDLAGLSHVAPYYRWACHHIHADAKNAAYMRQDTATGPKLLVGPTLHGLGEAGSWALRALAWCTEVMVLRAPVPLTPGYITTEKMPELLGIDSFLAEAEEALETAQKSATADAERIDRMYPASGLRGTVFRLFLRLRPGGMTCLQYGYPLHDDVTGEASVASDEPEQHPLSTQEHATRT